MLKQLFHVANTTRAAISQTYSADAANVLLNVTTIAGYVAGFSDITINITSNAMLYSTDPTVPALEIIGAAPTDTVTLVLNVGFIAGRGGDGGGVNGIASNPGITNTAGIWGGGGNGGTALEINSPVTINLTNASSYIGGGGGGGAGSMAFQTPIDPIATFTFNLYNNLFTGAGGAGGGNAGSYAILTSDTNITLGPAGGAPRTAGANGISINPAGAVGCPCNVFQIWTGGGGGRIFPGTGGAVTNPVISNFAGVGGGAGGAGCGSSQASTNATTNGGSGIAVGGSANLSDANLTDQSGGGGGWGASGGAGYNTVSLINQLGGAGGLAVKTNNFPVTWVSGDTTRVYGAIAP